MDKKNFNSIVRGLEQAASHAKGARKGFRATKVTVPDEVDVKAIRGKLEMTQREFSETFGFTLDAVKSWEIKRREPERSARILLRVIERNPRAVLEASV